MLLSASPQQQQQRQKNKKKDTQHNQEGSKPAHINTERKKVKRAALISHPQKQRDCLHRTVHPVGPTAATAAAAAAAAAAVSGVVGYAAPRRARSLYLFSFSPFL